MDKEKYFIRGAIPVTIISKAMINHKEEKETGAYSIFLGQVRNDFINKKRVLKITYSVYELMALQEIEKIKKKIFNKYTDLKSIFIRHSEGDVASGEISFIVLVSGGHRIQSREACAEIVDLFKKDVPVWKKEILEDYSHNWRKNEIL